MKTYLKHLMMTFLITSSCLLWGIAAGFKNNEILIGAALFVIFYWIHNGDSKT